MESPAAQSLARIGCPTLLSPPGWQCHRIQIENQGRQLRLGFSKDGGDDWCEIEVGPVHPSDRAFRRFTYCQASYHGLFSRPEVEAQARQLVHEIGQFVEQRLRLSPSRSIAEALGRDPRPRDLPFDVAGIRQLLSPLLHEGDEALAGYRLTRIRADRPSVTDKESAPEVLLGFQRPEMQGHVLFALELGSGDHRAFSRTAHLALRSLNDLPDSRPLRAWVAYLLQLQDHEAIRFQAPGPPDTVLESELATPAPAPTQSLDRPVILSLTSPCHQFCNFCSLRDTWSPEDGGATQLAAAVEELRRGRAAGADAYTLNGFDPLAFTGILQVLEAARDLGFEHAEVYSPCSLLAERSFCESIVERLPTSRRVHVPLYGLSASIHDAVVGRPGSYEKVITALENLVELLGPEAVTITSVSTRTNLQALPELFRFAIDRGIDLFSTMPYPATNFATDRLVDASPSQTEVAGVLVEALADHPKWLDRAAFGVAPCVIFPIARQRGIPVQRWLSAPRHPPQLNGGPEPRRVACPHSASCSISQACPGEFFERYVDRFGMEEFHPVPLYDLLRDAGAAERPSEGSQRRGAASSGKAASA